MTKQLISALFLLLFLLSLLAACQSDRYEAVEDVATLDVAFADGVWDGETVPEGQQCQRFDGAGITPEIIVKNIPAEATALVLQFSDGSYEPMDNGGHGIIGYEIESGSAEIIIPSAPGHTFDLPAGFFVVEEHANPDWDIAGGYMPPCSGGAGNHYYVTVMAVDEEQSLLLGEADLEMGRY